MPAASTTLSPELPHRINVAGCARCGQDHANLEIRPLANPPVWCRYWTVCPATNEPILVSFSTE